MLVAFSAHSLREELIKLFSLLRYPICVSCTTHGFRLYRRVHHPGQRRETVCVSIRLHVSSIATSRVLISREVMLRLLISSQ